MEDGTRSAEGGAAGEGVAAAASPGWGTPGGAGSPAGLAAAAGDEEGEELRATRTRNRLLSRLDPLSFVLLFAPMAVGLLVWYV